MNIRNTVRLLCSITIFLFVGVGTLKANEKTEMDFIGPFFDDIFQQLGFQIGQSSELTSLLYRKLLSYSSVKKKWIVNYIVFADENKKMPEIGDRLKIVDAMDWFFNLSGPIGKSKFNSQVQILGGFNMDCSRIRILVLGLEAHRYFLGEIQVDNLRSKNIVDKMLKIIGLGVDLSEKLNAIHADNLVNVDDSKVAYVFKTVNNNNINLEIDYDDTHKNVEGFNFDLRENVKDGVHEECIPTEEGNEICIAITVLKNEIVNKNIYMKTLNEKLFKITAVSNKGYKIYFNFNHGGGSNVDVQIVPMINPYAPDGYVMAGEKELKVVNEDYELNFTCKQVSQ